MPVPDNITIQVGKATISKVFKSGGQVVSETESNEEVGESQLYNQPTCNVGVSVGVTKNTGNFNSLKIQVSLHMPCYVEEIDPVYEYTKEWVDNKMDAIVAEIEE